MEKKNDVLKSLNCEKLKQMWQTFRKGKYAQYILTLAVSIISLLMGIVIGCGAERYSNRSSGGIELGVTEALDSFATMMPDGSKVVARFNDKRHSLYYLNTGHLMKFNAKSKMLEEVLLEKLNGDAKVYYDDKLETQGVLDATLSPDEKFIIITAVTEKPSAKSDEVTTGMFQLNTESMNVMPYEAPKKNKAVVKRDSTRRVAPKKVEEEVIEQPELSTDFPKVEPDPPSTTPAPVVTEPTDAPKSKPVERTLEEQPQ